jgi:hypothetical protein
VLLYLEDRAALDALAGAVRAAGGHADAVFGEPQDAFSLTEARARRNYEKGPPPAAVAGHRGAAPTGAAPTTPGFPQPARRYLAETDPAATVDDDPPLMHPEPP